MKIISFDYEPTTGRGGQERSLFDILTELALSGHKIKLAYVKKGDLIEGYEKAGVKCIKVDRFNVQNKFSLKQWRELYKSAKKLKSNGKCLVYINQIFDAPIAVLMKFLYGYKVVCHLRLPPLGMSGQIKLALKFIDKFIVPTQKMFELHVEQSKFKPEKITIIPNAFKFENLPEIKKEPNEIFKIAYIGRFDKAKGLEFLIDGMILLKEKTRDFKLEIAGKPLNQEHQKRQEYLMTRIKDANLEENVSFIGHVKNPVEHLSKYDLCIFPSQWEEPFGRVLVESLVAETPVIASNVGSVAEIINDPEKEWIFSSKEEMVDLILKIMDNPEIYPVKDKKNYVLEKYDLKKIIKQITETFENLYFK